MRLSSVAIAAVLFAALCAAIPVDQSATIADFTIQFSSDISPRTAAINAINAAVDTIDFAMYKYEDEPIHEALIAAIRRGVRVRAIVDKTESEDNNSLASDLHDSGATVRTWSGSGSFDKLHAKYAIFDSAKVLTGTNNWTDSGSETNMEVVTTFQSVDAAATFQKNFDTLFAQGREI